MIPKSLAEALEYLDKKKYKILAGGTDLLIQNRNHTSLPIGFKEDVMYVAGIEELDYIKTDEANVYIGATMTLEKLLANELTPKLLRETILEMASPAIRNTGTLAGNIGNASPAGDSLVPMYLLDAKVKLQSKSCQRIILLKDFILGPRKIDLDEKEMITEIIIPQQKFSSAYFVKVGPRLSDAISKLSFAAAYTEENGVIKDIRMSFGAVYMTVVRSRELEEKLIGKTIKEIKNMEDEIVAMYLPLIKPINDQRSNIAYRKRVSENLIRDFIAKL